MKRIILLSVAWLTFVYVFSGRDVSAVLQKSPAVGVPVTKGWTKTWGAGANEGAENVAVDGTGNLFVVGSFAGTVDFNPDPVNTDFHASNGDSIDAFVTKFDANGSFLWAKTWGGSGRDVAYGVNVDGSGNAYVVGPFRYTVDFNPDPAITESHDSNAVSENNIYLSKFSVDGTFQWVKTWGPALVPGRQSFGAEGYNVAIHGNDLYVVGDFSGDQTDFNPWGEHEWLANHVPASGTILFDAFLSKFDLNGNFQWAKSWGGEGYDDGPGVAVDSLGNVYVAGMYASQTINFDPAGGAGGSGHPAHDSGIIVDVFLSKFESDGDFLWVKTWGGQGTDDIAGNVAVDSSDRIYVAGRFASTNCDFNPGGTADIHSTEGLFDSFLSQYAADGTYQWSKTWGDSGDDMVMDLVVDGADHPYAAGRFHGTVDFNPGSVVDNRPSKGGYDAYLSQFDAGGNFLWAGTWGDSGDETAYVALDGSGKVYSAGGFAGTVDFNPGGGVDSHTSNGGQDVYLGQFLPLNHAVYLPLVWRSSLP